MRRIDAVTICAYYFLFLNISFVIGVLFSRPGGGKPGTPCHFGYLTLFLLLEYLRFQPARRRKIRDFFKAVLAMMAPFWQVLLVSLRVF